VQDCEQVSASVPESGSQPTSRSSSKPGSEPISEPISEQGSERSAPQPAAKVAASFPRSARLLKHSDFDRVYKQGRRHFSSHMTVYYLRRLEIAAPDQKSGQKSGQKTDSGARVGFTVGRVLGGAVDRNRIKRRLREAVRQRRAVLQGAPAVDVVINPKKSVLKLEFSLVLEEVGRALDTIAKKLLDRNK
jgi:ribonuclease P protein component